MCIRDSRMGAHTTSDDPSKYRTDEEVEPWKKRDPILRLEKYLLQNDLLKEADIEHLKTSFQEEAMAAYRCV